MDFSSKRDRMVEMQIIPRGVVSSRVITAMKKVPRERFVPADKARYAYDDCPLDIGHGQTISQPYIVALMSELAAVGMNDRVLEIGTGSGYQTAVLCELAGEVYTVERIKALYLRSSKVLEAEGYSNVHSFHSDGYAGYSEKSPYNAIVVTAAPEKVPEELLVQLSENGRLVIPVGSFIQQLMVFEKHGGRINSEIVTGVRFVPMLKKTAER